MLPARGLDPPWDVRGLSWGIAFVVGLLLLAPARSRADDDRDAWLGGDKLLHAGVSAGLGAGFYALGAPLVRPRPARAALGLVAASTLGAAKELSDLRGPGTASDRDFAWDVVGALAGVGLAALVDFAVNRLRARNADASHAGGQRLTLRW